MIPGGLRSAHHRAAVIVGATLFLAGSVSASEPLVSVAESGPVSASVSLSPPEPALGDPLILTLEVRAEPQVELLMASSRTDASTIGTQRN